MNQTFANGTMVGNHRQNIHGKTVCHRCLNRLNQATVAKEKRAPGYWLFRGCFLGMKYHPSYSSGCFELLFVLVEKSGHARSGCRSHRLVVRVRGDRYYQVPLTRS